MKHGLLHFDRQSAVLFGSHSVNGHALIDPTMSEAAVRYEVVKLRAHGQLGTIQKALNGCSG
jgi:hypothetical protein